MKKVAMILAILLVVCIPLRAHAATWSLRTISDLTFSGTTAKCSVNVVGDKMTDHFEVTMWLMDGTNCIASWHSSGDGYVTVSKTATVTPGRTYKLVVEVFVNGVTKDPVYVTGTC